MQTKSFIGGFLAAFICLSLSATAQIWGPVVAGFTTGGVIYGAGGVAAQNATKFYWDGTNHRLGLGNAAPTVTLDVTGDAKVSGTLTPAGALSVTGNFAVNTNKFNVTAASGNTTVAGTLGVTGATTLSSAVTLDKGSTGLFGTLGNTTKWYGYEAGGTIGWTTANTNLGTGVTATPASNSTSLVINGSPIFTAAATGVTVLGAGSTTLTGAMTVTGTPIFSYTASPTSGSACTLGTFTWDTAYLYICTSSGAWRRVATTGAY